MFEGLKAYRFDDGTVSMFRPDQNMQRLYNSAKRLSLPVCLLYIYIIFNYIINVIYINFMKLPYLLFINKNIFFIIFFRHLTEMNS